MHNSMTRSTRRSVLLALLAFAASTAGCAMVGAPALRGSRSVYNEAIIATNSQQVLDMIVRMRFGEPTGLLAVASVTANMRVRGSLGAQVGFGSSSGYQGNLVPLSAGVAYEENPTISYTPVQGEKHFRQLVAPLPLDIALLVLESSGSPENLTLLLRGVNGVRNRPSPDGTRSDFQRVVELLSALEQSGDLDWVSSAREEGSAVLFLEGASPDYSSNVRELGRLLGFDRLSERRAVSLPIVLGVGKPSRPEIVLRTRSLYEILQIAASSVEAPAAQVESGLALPVPAGLVAPMRIRRTDGNPDDAMVAVRRHGSWYSISGTDVRSKRTFRLLEALITARLADSGNHQAAPVLTVPVSQ